MTCPVSSIFRWASNICELPCCRLGCPSYPPTPGCHLEIKVPGDTLYSFLINYPDNVKSLSLSRPIMYKWYIMQPQIVVFKHCFGRCRWFSCANRKHCGFPSPGQDWFLDADFLGMSNIQHPRLWVLKPLDEDSPAMTLWPEVNFRVRNRRAPREGMYIGR